MSQNKIGLKEKLLCDFKNIKQELTEKINFFEKNNFRTLLLSTKHQKDLSFLEGQLIIVNMIITTLEILTDTE